MRNNQTVVVVATLIGATALMSGLPDRIRQEEWQRQREDCHPFRGYDGEDKRRGGGRWLGLPVYPGLGSW